MEHDHHQSHRPLHMIVQGKTRIGKSYLIASIKEMFNKKVHQQKVQLLLVAPIGIVAFNIHTTTICSKLRIPIKDMQPLQGQALIAFQE